MSNACCEMQLHAFYRCIISWIPHFWPGPKFGCFWSPCRLRKFRAFAWLAAVFFLPASPNSPHGMFAS